MKSNGKIVITLPNVTHWSIRLGILLGKFKYKERGIFDKTHLKFFTKGSALDLIQKAGLKAIENRAIPVPLPLFFPFLREKSPFVMFHAINYIFTQTWRSLFAYQWAFLCEAVPGVRTGKLRMEKMDHEKLYENKY